MYPFPLCQPLFMKRWLQLPLLLLALHPSYTKATQKAAHAVVGALGAYFLQKSSYLPSASSDEQLTAFLPKQGRVVTTSEDHQSMYLYRCDKTRIEESSFEESQDWQQEEISFPWKHGEALQRVAIDEEKKHLAALTTEGIWVWDLKHLAEAPRHFPCSELMEKEKAPGDLLFIPRELYNEEPPSLVAAIGKRIYRFWLTEEELPPTLLYENEELEGDIISVDYHLGALAFATKERVRVTFLPYHAYLFAHAETAPYWLSMPDLFGCPFTLNSVTFTPYGNCVAAGSLTTKKGARCSLLIRWELDSHRLARYDPPLVILSPDNDSGIDHASPARQDTAVRFEDGEIGIWQDRGLWVPTSDLSAAFYEKKHKALQLLSDGRLASITVDGEVCIFKRANLWDKIKYGSSKAGASIQSWAAAMGKPKEAKQ